MAARKYECHKCGVSGVKLWRDYGMPFHWDLWCVDCACAQTGEPYSHAVVDPATIGEDGMRVNKVRFVLADARGGPVMVAFDGPVPEASYLGVYGDKKIDRHEERTDTIGWRSPAIPIDAADDNTHPEAYWGYSSWSEENDKDFVWWGAQPLRATT